jgi:hypothetical protein
VKRGPKPEGYVPPYVARHGNLAISREMKGLIQRRTEPFLDSVGISRPIGHLLQEAYLQGLRDALEAGRTSP